MNKPFIPNDLITPLEASKLLQVDSVTIRRWVHAGTLPAFKVGGRLRISRKDVLGQIHRVKTEGPQIKTLAELEARDKRAKDILRDAGVIPKDA
jgi:excisionase family DNA binding protein